MVATSIRPVVVMGEESPAMGPNLGISAAMGNCWSRTRRSGLRLASARQRTLDGRVNDRRSTWLATG